MTDKEMKQKLDESVAYFEDFINKVLPQNIEGYRRCSTNGCDETL
jgi:hypothetical protein